MKQTTLKGLPIKDLFKLLTENNNELYGMERNKEDKKIIREKQKEVETIQRILIAKRLEHPPGK